MFWRLRRVLGIGGIIGCLGASNLVATDFPLHASENGRYLVDQKGAPFLIHGDTMWKWQMNRSFASRSDVLSYLDTRAKQGFTVIALHGLIEKSEAQGALPDEDGNMPFLKEVGPGSGVWRLDSPNPAYFDGLKWFVDECRKRDMLVCLSPLWLGYRGLKKGWFEEIASSSNTEEVCYEYGQYLGREFADCPNILWMHGGDRVPDRTETARIHKIMEGIRSVAPSTVLHTAHWRRPPEDNLSRDVAAFSDVDVELVYSAALPYWGCLRSWTSGRLPVLPAFVGESYYENQTRFNPPGPWPPAMVRRQAYWAILSGAGHLYGIHSATPPSVAESPGAWQMKHVKDTFTARAWYDLIPDFDHRIVTNGWGRMGVDENKQPQIGDSYVTAAGTPDGSLLMAYLPPLPGKELRTLTVDLTKLKIPVEGKWMDPSNGRITPIPGGPFAKNESRDFSPPGLNAEGTNDWLLILEPPGAGK